jgi:hypothetical protein
MNQKDRLGETLRLKERAEEDLYFASRDRELLARLKHAAEAERDKTLRPLARARCPVCEERLSTHSLHGARIEACPSCEGCWLDKDVRQQLSVGARESWIEHFLTGLSHLLNRPHGVDVSRRDTVTRLTS